MFLKSLTLKGFKSFADTTRLDFEPGVTVVVGPNGSGKSNVVDAVAWVLGAQGPTTVRSAKMDDVIFAGTTKRAALGRAEVQLTLDNSAGLLPIEFTELTIGRTLYRSGDSEYTLNGVGCRLLDIQELLSDAGVGRNQHVIVAQGQIDDVLNARPTDRRLIIEEAAGVLKFRRRKERAERRLEATEANLLRLQDLQREVRRQLRPLQRQAEAARRHGDLVEEQRAIRLHLLGRELDVLGRRLSSVAVDRQAAAGRERDARGGLARLDVDVAAAEARLTATGDDLPDVATRVESLRERAAGLRAVVAERRRTLEGELASQVSADLVGGLEVEADQIRQTLDRVEGELTDLVPRQQDLDAAEASLSADEAGLDDGETVAVAEISRQAAHVRGEVQALGRSVERDSAELRRMDARHAERQAEVERLGASAVDLRRRLEEAEAVEAEHVQACDGAAAAVAAAEARLAAAEAAVDAAETEQRRLRARGDALSDALDDARASAGMQVLDGVEGVVGILAELVEIDEGWELAVEAAAGEAIAAVVAADGAAAREVLRCLHAADTTGAVVALGDASGPAVRPAAGEPVRDHVHADDPRVARLLDRLLGVAVAVRGGWHEAADLAGTVPGAIVVTRDGDRFSSTAWRVGAGTAGATRAALEEAEAAGRIAAAARSQASDALRAAASHLEGCRLEREHRAERLHIHDRHMTGLTDELGDVEARRRDLAAVAVDWAERRAILDESLARDGARLTELESLLATLRQDEERGREVADRHERRRHDLEQRSRSVAALRAELAAQQSGLVERRRLLADRVAEVDERLAVLQEVRDRAGQRRERIGAKQAAVDRLGRLLARHEARLGELAAQVAERRRRQSAVTRDAAARLEALRHERTRLDSELEEARAETSRCDVAEAEARLRLEAVAETVRTDLDADPESAAATPCPPLPEGASAAGRLRELDRELRRLGPVNPLALQEFEELSERHDFVASQLEDVRRGRRELQKVIAGIDAEIVRVFTTAFVDVAHNFEQLFLTLFPGGTGRLSLSDADNLLESGVELEARPSGKNVGKLSLLSGGERSLTALAFLFAVFRSRPSPFYVLDEVEAALDDVNLHRFLDLVDEFRREAQLVVVSHQRRTMEAADCLYGVSMQPGGSSKVVSERAADAA